MRVLHIHSGVINLNPILYFGNPLETFSAQNIGRLDISPNYTIAARLTLLFASRDFNCVKNRSKFNNFLRY